MDDRPLEKTRVMGYEDLPVNAKEQPSRRRLALYLVPLAAISFGAFASIALAVMQATDENSPPPPTPPELAECAPERVVLVAGIESIDGDDPVARDLTQELKIASGSRPGWITSTVGATFPQMVILSDCNPRMMSCLRQIAEEFEADRLVFGYIHRVPMLDDRSSYDFEYEVLCYDRELNDIIGVASGVATSERFGEARQIASAAIAECLD